MAHVDLSFFVQFALPLGFGKFGRKDPHLTDQRKEIDPKRAFKPKKGTDSPHR
jgi:hypothetical protein